MNLEGIVKERVGFELLYFLGEFGGEGDDLEQRNYDKTTIPPVQ